MSRGLYIPANSALLAGAWNGADQFIMILPRSWKRDQSVVGILSAHGAQGSALQDTSAGATGVITVPIADQLGLPVFASDLGEDGTAGRPTNIGSPTHINAINGAAAYMTSPVSQAGLYNQLWKLACKAGPVIGVGYSAGASGIFNTAARFPGLFKAIVAISGGVDLQYIWNNNKAGLQAPIDLAFGGVVPTAPTDTSHTAGATAYNYWTVVRYNLPGGGTIDGVRSAPLAYNAVAMASLGATPNTLGLPAAPTTNNPLHGAEANLLVIRQVAGGALELLATLAIGAVAFVDNVTAQQPLYVPVTTPWTTNGYHGNDGTAACFNPVGYMPAALTDVPCQFWWSPHDSVIGPNTGVGGPMPSTVAAFVAGYGPNLQAVEIPGDPVHASSTAALSANRAAMATLLGFVQAHA